jgi:DNA-binding transcriptional LysR family regulator
MRLRSLERTLGLELLDRSSRGAGLTAAGVAVVRWSEEVLDGLQNLLLGAAQCALTDEHTFGSLPA